MSRQDDEIDKIFKEVKEMFGGKLIDNHKHWTMNCIGCACDIFEVIQISFFRGMDFEHRNSCRDRKNCKICKGRK
jgi:hypothetical protein